MIRQLLGEVFSDALHPLFDRHIVGVGNIPFLVPLTLLFGGLFVVFGELPFNHIQAILWRERLEDPHRLQRLGGICRIVLEISENIQRKLTVSAVDRVVVEQRADGRALRAASMRPDVCDPVTQRLFPSVTHDVALSAGCGGIIGDGDIGEAPLHGFVLDQRYEVVRRHRRALCGDHGTGNTILAVGGNRRVVRPDSVHTAVHCAILVLCRGERIESAARGAKAVIRARLQIRRGQRHASGLLAKCIGIRVCVRQQIALPREFGVGPAAALYRDAAAHAVRGTRLQIV